jgi:simple sugar transport system ATP-binding protein
MMENGTSNGTANGQDFLRVEDVVKRFGAISVLKGVNLHVKEGEVLGLIGDNGAGKSTLLKTITGFHRPDGGKILIEGDEVNLRSVSQARSLGIQTVYQDLALVNELSVFHNMFLNSEMTLGPFLNNRKMKEKTAQYMADMGVNIPSIDTEVASLSGGQRARSTRTPRCSSSTSRWRRWGPRRGRSSSTSSNASRTSGAYP